MTQSEAIIALFQNNVGNKLTVELSNGMLAELARIFQAGREEQPVQEEPTEE